MSSLKLNDSDITALNITTEYGNKLEEELQSLMNGADYDRGAVEEAQATASKTGVVLSKLLVRLLDKGIITKDDLRAIVQYIF